RDADASRKNIVSSEFIFQLSAPGVRREQQVPRCDRSVHQFVDVDEEVQTVILAVERAFDLLNINAFKIRHEHFRKNGRISEVDRKLKVLRSADHRVTFKRIICTEM